MGQVVGRWGGRGGERGGPQTNETKKDLPLVGAVREGKGNEGFGLGGGQVAVMMSRRNGGGCIHVYLVQPVMAIVFPSREGNDSLNASNHLVSVI